MQFLGFTIFMLSVFLVFTKRFCDGLVAKHFLVFSAITAMIVIHDPYNSDALWSSIGLFIAGMVYWFIKHYREICNYLSHL